MIISIEPKTAGSILTIKTAEDKTFPERRSLKMGKDESREIARSMLHCKNADDIIPIIRDLPKSVPQQVKRAITKGCKYCKKWGMQKEFAPMCDPKDTCCAECPTAVIIASLSMPDNYFFLDSFERVVTDYWAKRYKGKTEMALAIRDEKARKLYAESNLTQKEIADQMGISESTVSCACKNT